MAANVDSAENQRVFNSWIPACHQKAVSVGIRKQFRRNDAKILLCNHGSDVSAGDGRTHEVVCDPIGPEKCLAVRGGAQPRASLESPHGSSTQGRNCPDFISAELATVVDLCSVGREGIQKLTSRLVRQLQ